MTSIEWLENELKKSVQYYLLIEDIVEKAKEMHKQEIADAYEEGYNRAAKVIEDETQRIIKNNI